MPRLQRLGPRRLPVTDAAANNFPHARADNNPDDAADGAPEPVAHDRTVHVGADSHGAGVCRLQRRVCLEPSRVRRAARRAVRDGWVWRQQQLRVLLRHAKPCAHDCRVYVSPDVSSGIVRGRWRDMLLVDRGLPRRWRVDIRH